MKESASKPSRDDVLNAFAVEDDYNAQVLERYLKDYPEFSVDLRSLANELSKTMVEDTSPLSEKDKALIASSWKKHVKAAPSSEVDVLNSLSIETVRQLALTFDVPRQIIAALRERKVAVASIPNRFLGSFAAAINVTSDRLRASLLAPPQLRVAGSYKADNKPQAVAQISFEQLLIEAGVSDERRAVLLKDD